VKIYWLDMKQLYTFALIISQIGQAVLAAGPCRCNAHTEQGRTPGVVKGKCLIESADGCGKWCYVNNNSNCEDARESFGAPYRWSCLACQLQREHSGNSQDLGLRSQSPDTSGDGFEGRMGSFAQPTASSAIKFPDPEGDVKRPEPFLNLLVQDCKTEVYSIPGECTVTCGVGLRPVERVVAIVQQKNLLGKDCTETPGRRPGQPEPCNTNQICPTDPPETTYPPETTNAPDGIGVRIGLDGENETTHRIFGMDVENSTLIWIVLGGCALLLLACLAGICCCCGCCLQRFCSRPPPARDQTFEAKNSSNYQKASQQETVVKRKQETTGYQERRSEYRDSFFYDDVDNYDELP